jgi:hypothetical protein
MIVISRIARERMRLFVSTACGNERWQAQQPRRRHIP